MKSIARVIICAFAIIAASPAFSSCDKEEAKGPCFVYAADTAKPMPDVLEIKIGQPDNPAFVPSDGKKPVAYDDAHLVHFMFDKKDTGNDKFTVSSISAGLYDLEGWVFAFKAKTGGDKAAEPGDTDMVTIVYDNDGISIVKRLKLVAVK